MLENLREQNQAEQERRDKRDAEGMRKAENPMEIMKTDWVISVLIVVMKSI